MYEINKNIFNKHKQPPTKPLIEIAMLTSGEDTILLAGTQGCWVMGPKFCQESRRTQRPDALPLSLLASFSPTLKRLWPSL